MRLKPFGKTLKINLEGLAKEFPPFVVDEKREEVEQKKRSSLWGKVFDKVKLVGVASALVFFGGPTVYTAIECGYNQVKMSQGWNRFGTNINISYDGNKEEAVRIEIANEISKAGIPENISRIPIYVTSFAKRAHYFQDSNRILIPSKRAGAISLFHEMGHAYLNNLNEKQKKIELERARDYNQKINDLKNFSAKEETEEYYFAQGFIIPRLIEREDLEEVYSHMFSHYFSSKLIEKERVITGAVIRRSIGEKAFRDLFEKDNPICAIQNERIIFPDEVDITINTGFEDYTNAYSNNIRNLTGMIIGLFRKN